MQKNITARHFDLTPELRTKAEAEMDGLTRMAELKVKVYKDVLTGTAETDDMYNSIANAVDKVKGQLKKYKGKLKGKDPERIADITETITKPLTNDEDLDV